MKPIRYELEAYFSSLGGWMVTQWPDLTERGEPETLGEARDRLAVKKARNPAVEYRVVKCVRTVIDA